MKNATDQADKAHMDMMVSIHQNGPSAQLNSGVRDVLSRMMAPSVALAIPHGAVCHHYEAWDGFLA